MQPPASAAATASSPSPSDAGFVEVLLRFSGTVPGQRPSGASGHLPPADCRLLLPAAHANTRVILAWLRGGGPPPGEVHTALQAAELLGQYDTPPSGLESCHLRFIFAGGILGQRAALLPLAWPAPAGTDARITHSITLICSISERPAGSNERAAPASDASDINLPATGFDRLRVIAGMSDPEIQALRLLFHQGAAASLMEREHRAALAAPGARPGHGATATGAPAAGHYVASDEATRRRLEDLWLDSLVESRAGAAGAGRTATGPDGVAIPMGTDDGPQAAPTAPAGALIGNPDTDRPESGAFMDLARGLLLGFLLGPLALFINSAAGDSLRQIVNPARRVSVPTGPRWRLGLMFGLSVNVILSMLIFV
ncbi:hypothetical protein H696_01045 [Fonticula alba]|uniref:DSC E3 ubiquitin ligase complex subunit 3 C-terminal domain-containing protein n=1 Tax=Fonticula alba TaxID=691883 RepID=A0A058ZCG0_FONAL|nr:hypothetical protein H696_01045 [Fonticula alba]KCV71626.1 hypothetical protein H696_01045 [Fonticula alba]|eukprot:XP_009493204.1 hypothetical protein H696_01045 [Fonticula alba]